MNIHLLTLDFRQTPLALREKVAFPEYRLAEALKGLQQTGASEAAILSTCNRVVLMAQYPSSIDGQNMLIDFVCQSHGVSASDVKAHSRHLINDEAATHLMSVACGLESLVPGEMQILGQVKKAAGMARKVGVLGNDLGRLFDRALRAGHRARNETNIARRPVSISHAAVALIQQKFGKDLSGRRVLLIGSGKMGEIAAQQLHKAGASHFIVANRTLERACKLAQRWDGTPLALDKMPDALSQVDAVVSATGAPHLILSPAHITSAMQNKAEADPSSLERTLLLIDLAVPRDIDPEVANIPGVTLCDVDGLQAVVADNIALRHSERDKVEAIIEQELAKYLKQQAARRVAPTITSLRRTADEIRQAELEKALNRLSSLNEKERGIIEALSRGLMNKLLHYPTIRLREKAATTDGVVFQQTVEELFALN